MVEARDSDARTKMMGLQPAPHPHGSPSPRATSHDSRWPWPGPWKADDVQTRSTASWKTPVRVHPKCRHRFSRPPATSTSSHPPSAAAAQRQERTILRPTAPIPGIPHIELPSRTNRCRRTQVTRRQHAVGSRAAPRGGPCSLVMTELWNPASFDTSAITGQFRFASLRDSRIRWRRSRRCTGSLLTLSRESIHSSIRCAGHPTARDPKRMAAGKSSACMRR